MPAELKPDDEVTDWQYQWQGPDGAEAWWPAMPFVHAQLYLVTLFPAFLLGVLTRRTTEAGVMLGLGVSLAVMVAVHSLSALAWTWYVLAGTIVCVLVGLAASRR